MKHSRPKQSGWRRFLARWRELTGRPRFLVYAILVHVIFFVMLVLSLDWRPTPRPAPVKANVVDAVVVDEARVQAELEKLRQAEARKQRRSRDLEQARLREEKRLAALKKKRRQEQHRLQSQEKKRRAEAKRIATLKKKRQLEQHRLQAEKKKRLEETKRVAALKKKRQAAQRQLEKKREEQARLAALKKEQAELERQRRRAEAKRRQAAEQELQRRLAAEQQRLAQAREAKVRSIVDQAIIVIKQKVNRNWLRPPKIKKGLSCQVLVQLIPGGDVVSVRIIQSSGDPIFDRSVESAVRKASPLPLPKDRTLFDRFRELKFIFKPEG